MKKKSKARFNNIALYKAMDNFYDDPQSQIICHKAGILNIPAEDTRYYGVFLTNRKDNEIKVDIKRFEKKLGLPSSVSNTVKERTGHYFIPAKKDFYDYNCNLFFDVIKRIKDDWQKEYKPLIDKTIKDIPDAEYRFEDMCGILEPDEALTNSMILQAKAQAKVQARRNRLYLSLYAQFFHQMVPQIEALTVSVLTNNGYEGDRFDRNVLYAFKGANQSKIKELNGFKEYDTLYAIWHFIKHNSKSTYDTLLAIAPEILIKDSTNDKKLLEYRQGDLAIFYINFTNELIENLLDGVQTFFIEYCKIVFNENYDEAQWNYSKFFLSKVNDEIEMLQNPLGLSDWI